MTDEWARIRIAKSLCFFPDIQFFGPTPPLWHNVELPLDLHGTPADERIERAKAAMRRSSRRAHET